MQHLTIGPRTPWALPVPLVVVASPTDRVWPVGVMRRWEDVVPADKYRCVVTSKISHFALLAHDEVQKAVTDEVAAAARAGVGM